MMIYDLLLLLFVGLVLVLVAVNPGTPYFEFLIYVTFVSGRKLHTTTGIPLLDYSFSMADIAFHLTALCFGPPTI